MSFSDCFSQHFSLALAAASIPDMPHARVSGFMIGTGVMALFLAVILAPLGQLAYSRSLRRLVKLRQIEDAPVTLWTRRGARLRAPSAAQRLNSMPLAEASRVRERRIQRATWVSYGMFVVYGFGVMQAFKTDRELEDSALVLCYLVGMTFGPAAVNMAPYGFRRALMLVPLLIVALWSSVEPLSARTVALAIGALLCLYVITVHRTMRAVVLPLAVLCVSVGVSLGLGLWMFLADALRCRSPVYGPNDYQAILGLLLLMAAVFVVLALCAATVFLRVLVRIVERGWLSDISLVAVCGVIVLGGFLTVGVEMRTTSAMNALLFFGWVALTLGAYVVTLRTVTCPADSCTLLVLRVFSRGSKAERLLDALQNRWRLVGPVLEMGGPDLSRLNLELRGFLKFLSPGLFEILHPRGATEAAFRSSLDLAIDREGRFRINELFSFNSSWTSVLEHLLLLSDVVLLDLRGFNSERAGTTYELLRLGALGRMGRVLTMYDSHTDWSYFDALLSKVEGLECVAPVRIDADSGDALRHCFEGLLQLAESARDRRPTAVEPAPDSVTPS
jgi:hypothetical protein